MEYEIWINYKLETQSNVEQEKRTSQHENWENFAPICRVQIIQQIARNEVFEEKVSQ